MLSLAGAASEITGDGFLKKKKKKKKEKKKRERRKEKGKEIFVILCASGRFNLIRCKLQ